MGPHGEVGGWLALDLADPRLPLTADLTPKDMELAELLQKLGVPRSHVVLRSSGRVQAKGTLLPLQLEGSVALELADFAVLDRRFEERARAGRVLEFPRGRLVSAVTVQGDEVALRNAVLDVGGSRLRVDGSLFTDLKRGLDLHAAGEGFLLEEFRGHIGKLPWKGRITLDARIRGPYEDPAITSEASIRDLHFDDLALGDVSTQVAFHGLKLSFDQIEGIKERSSYAGAVALDFADDRIPVDAHVELLQAQLHDVVEMSVGVVPAFSVLRDRADVDGLLRGTLEVHGPVEAPDGFAKIEFGDVSFWGERFRGGQASLTLRGGEPILKIDELRLRHGAASVVFQGRVGPRWELSIDGRTDGLTLAEVDHGKQAQLQGPLSVTAQVRGVAAHPLVDLRIGFSGATAGKALVGDGAIGIAVDGAALSWRGKVGTHSFEGRGKLEGDFGYSSTLALRFPDLSGYFATFAPDADLTGGSLSADVALRGSLLELQDSEGSISLTAMKLIKGDLAFENDGPGQLSFGPDGVSVQRLAVKAPYTSARISGVARRSLLDVRVEANVDGRILQGLVPDIEHATGAYLLHATLTGTPRAPSVLGNLRVENAEVRLSGLPLSFREMNGSVSFSQDALVIDDMGGKVNNGLARVSGGMEMKSLSPQRIDLAVHMSDVVAKLQDNLTANLDGDLTLYGPPLEPTLGGNLTVSRMTYAEDLNIERSLLDFNRRQPSPRVLEKSQVLVHFDLGVHLARAVRIENNLARADLKGDLQVTGTTRRVGLLGSLNTVHGTAQFRGNEFVIDQGVLSFTDRQSIRPSFDLQASAQVKEYKVRLHAFGTPGEPHVTLVSDPVLAEADLGFLLTFGFVSQNLQQAGFAAADSGLALGVEALNRFTGFSEEVRRFIPKNAILKDPNIDFTTDFSVASSRLEPMARFRSRVVTDRLDLRVLQGLSTRRYRGVVSYQLTDLLSAQLQLDNEHVSQGTDFGADLKLHWEGGE
jgi:translocation and assembly module TamB